MNLIKGKSLISVFIAILFTVTHIVIPMPSSYADAGAMAGEMPTGMERPEKPVVNVPLDASGEKSTEDAKTEIKTPEQKSPVMGDDNPLEKPEEPRISPEQFERHLQNLKSLSRRLAELINPNDVKQRQLGGKLPGPGNAEPDEPHHKALFQQMVDFRNHLITVKDRIDEIIDNMERIKEGLNSSISSEVTGAKAMLDSEEGDEIVLSIQVGGRQRRAIDLYQHHIKQMLKLEDLMRDQEGDVPVIRQKLAEMQRRLIAHQDNILTLEDIDDTPLGDRDEVIDALAAEAAGIARDQQKIDRALRREFAPVKAKNPRKRFVPPVIPGGGFVVNPAAAIVAALQAEILWQETQITAQILAIEGAFKAGRVPPKMVSEMNRRLFILKFVQLPMTLVLKRSLGAVISIFGVRNVIRVLTNRHNIIAGDYLILKREGWMV